jgi:hypothetical protein
MLQCFVCGGNHFQNDYPRVMSGERQPISLGVFPTQVGPQQPPPQPAPPGTGPPQVPPSNKGAGRGEGK